MKKQSLFNSRLRRILMEAGMTGLGSVSAIMRIQSSRPDLGDPEEIVRLYWQCFEEAGLSGYFDSFIDLVARSGNTQADKYIPGLEQLLEELKKTEMRLARFDDVDSLDDMKLLFTGADASVYPKYKNLAAKFLEFKDAGFKQREPIFTGLACVDGMPEEFYRRLIDIAVGFQDDWSKAYMARRLLMNGSLGRNEFADMLQALDGRILSGLQPALLETALYYPVKHNPRLGEFLIQKIPLDRIPFLYNLLELPPEKFRQAFNRCRDKIMRHQPQVYEYLMRIVANPGCPEDVTEEIANFIITQAQNRYQRYMQHYQPAWFAMHACNMNLETFYSLLNLNDVQIDEYLAVRKDLPDQIAGLLKKRYSNPGRPIERKHILYALKNKQFYQDSSFAKLVPVC